MTQRIITSLRDRHCDEAAFLWTLRIGMLSRPDISLAELEAVDLRIEAHLDGIRSSGKGAWEAGLMLLDKGGAGHAFLATTLALESKRRDRLVDVLTSVAKRPPDWSGVVSAFGWASRANLTGVVSDLLKSHVPALRALGLDSCAMHCVDPGLMLAESLTQQIDSTLRMRALRAAGQLGRVELLPACLDALNTEEVAQVAAWAAALLGDRGMSLERLSRRDTAPQMQALLPLLLDIPSSNSFLKSLAAQDHKSRRLVRSIGLAGNTHYVPWLLKTMTDPALARLAGEAFCTITGLDLDAAGLVGKAPNGFEVGPNDDPLDDRVEMDEDSGIPWPDVARLSVWWSGEYSRFPTGTRFFMGQPLDATHFQHVLHHGTQRQRAAAAQHLTLLRPGLALFNIEAPAWRQRQSLA